MSEAVDSHIKGATECAKQQNAAINNKADTNNA